MAPIVSLSEIYCSETYRGFVDVAHGVSKKTPRSLRINYPKLPERERFGMTGSSDFMTILVCVVVNVELLFAVLYALIILVGLFLESPKIQTSL